MEHVVVSTSGSTRGTAYAMSNKILSHEGRTHVAWLDESHSSYVRTLDRASGAWSEPSRVGDGKDNHAGPALAMDSEGRLHLVFGPHGDPIQHAAGVDPNSAASWSAQPRLGGTAATYPSLVCDGEDTLHVCYRGGYGEERPLGLMYQKRRKGGAWSRPVMLVDSQGPRAYTQYTNALHLTPDGRLYLAYHIVRAESANHARVRGMGFGFMRSDDGGETWRTMAGEPLTLPTTPASPCVIEFDELLDLRMGNVTCDTQGNPYFSIQRWEAEVPEAHLYRWRSRGWESIPLLPECRKLYGDCRNADVFSVSVSDDDLLYAAGVVAEPGDGWGGATNEIVLFVSRDLGETFAGYAVSPRDRAVANWLPSLERHTGHNRVGIPALVYTHGQKGVGLSPGLATEIRFVPLEPLVRAEEETARRAIAAGESMIGLSFTEEQRERIRKRVDGNRSAYRSLRALEIGYDVEPPLSFVPGVPGSARKLPRGAGSLRLADPGSLPRPASDEDLAFLPAISLAHLIRTRRVSPVELTRLYLRRCEAYGPRLNCVVTLAGDPALRQARKAEKEIMAGRYRGPLHGIPWGAKDLLATRGIRTTWGATPFEGQVIDRDATVVERLRRAGAILVAKLSMGALAMGPHWFGGTTRNPHSLEGDSSGSSAGSGAATAAGLVGFSIGSETLGSIVSPSHRCGIVGLRPTYGRVSRHGAMALSWTMDKLGPMCRGVEDCAAVLAAIHGPDGRDRMVARVPFRYPPERNLSELRVGFLAAEFEEVADAEDRASDRAALDALRSLGLDLRPVSLPDSPHGAIRILLAVEAAAAFDDLTRAGEMDRMIERDKSSWPDTFRAHRMVPAVEYLRAQRARALLMREMEHLMSEWDVLVAPATGGASLTVTNLTGHPALLVPSGYPGGQPRGMTLIGNLYEEAILLMAGRAYEQATEWHGRRPDMGRI